MPREDIATYQFVAGLCYVIMAQDTTIDELESEIGDLQDKLRKKEGKK